MNRDPHPLELAAVAVLALAWAVWQIARLLLVHAAALLLLLAGWRPAWPAAFEAPPAPIAASEPVAPAVALACAPEPAAIPTPPLEELNVAPLHRLARVAGLPSSLSRSGRRAQRLDALAAAWLEGLRSPPVPTGAKSPL